MNDLKGKTAIITGASRGIGLGVATKLAQHGCNIVINYFGTEEEGNAALETVKAFGTECLLIPGNVAKLEDCQALVDATKEKFGSIDIIVNNAGITRDNLVMRMSEADFDMVVDVNLKGTWNMVKASNRIMLKQRKGVIINMASVVGLMGNPGQSNYVATKAGVIGMTKSFAKEFGSRGVRVNAIAPGFIETPMTDALSDEVKKQYESTIPLQRFGQVEDIANAVAFLSSDLSNYITGQVISVNGGMFG